jgi:Bacterial regulatory proteins, lacI family
MTDRRPAPTIHDVARNVGVSTATVRRARSGRGTVRPHTRDAVIAAARTLGYRPSGIRSSCGRSRMRPFERGHTLLPGGGTIRKARRARRTAHST